MNEYMKYKQIALCAMRLSYHYHHMRKCSDVTPIDRETHHGMGLCR